MVGSLFTNRAEGHGHRVWHVLDRCKRGKIRKKSPKKGSEYGTVVRQGRQQLVKFMCHGSLCPLSASGGRGGRGASFLGRPSIDGGFSGVVSASFKDRLGVLGNWRDSPGRGRSGAVDAMAETGENRDAVGVTRAAEAVAGRGGDGACLCAWCNRRPDASTGAGTFTEGGATAQSKTES